jgi:hypothetical protein
MGHKAVAKDGSRDSPSMDGQVETNMLCQVLVVELSNLEWLRKFLVHSAAEGFTSKRQGCHVVQVLVQYSATIAKPNLDKTSRQ